ncbi:MAG: hypothetical protein DK303_000514 [Chloroflexi bacterium]|jgi:hypothetical protein|nr:MAG: hypothetical protein DK303_000514 [Chloroflexota bacterium]
MSHDNEPKPDIPPEYISELSIDAKQWVILEPLAKSASNSVKMLDQFLTVETESSAIFVLGKV